MSIPITKTAITDRTQVEMLRFASSPVFVRAHVGACAFTKHFGKER